MIPHDMEMTGTKSKKKSIFAIIVLVVLVLAGIVYLKPYYFAPRTSTTGASCDDGNGKKVNCSLLLVSLRTGLTVAEKDALAASIVKLGASVDRLEFVDTWAVTRSSTATEEIRKLHDDLRALPNVTDVEYDTNNTQPIGN